MHTNNTYTRTTLHTTTTQIDVVAENSATGELSDVSSENFETAAASGGSTQPVLSYVSMASPTTNGGTLEAESSAGGKIFYTVRAREAATSTKAGVKTAAAAADPVQSAASSAGTRVTINVYIATLSPGTAYTVR